MSEIYPGYNYRVRTPDGTMFVNVMEDSLGNIFDIQVFIGKSGSSLAAWTAATCGMISLALRNKVPLQKIIDELADITSDGTARIGAVINCRSGPEGIYSALIQYRNDVRERDNAREAPAEGVELRDSSEIRSISASREALGER